MKRTHFRSVLLFILEAAQIDAVRIKTQVENRNDDKQNDWVKQRREFHSSERQRGCDEIVWRRIQEFVVPQTKDRFPPGQREDQTKVKRITEEIDEGGDQRPDEFLGRRCLAGG